MVVVRVRVVVVLDSVVMVLTEGKFPVISRVQSTVTLSHSLTCEQEWRCVRTACVRVCACVCTGFESHSGVCSVVVSGAFHRRGVDLFGDRDAQDIAITLKRIRIIFERARFCPTVLHSFDNSSD